MIPAKARDFIVEIAQQIDIPEEDLSKMISFYFKENRRIMSQLETSHVMIPGLGTFNLKGWGIQQIINEKRGKLLRSSKEENIKSLEHEIALLQSILTRWNHEEFMRKEHKKKRNEYIANKTISNEFEIKGTIPNSLEE